MNLLWNVGGNGDLTANHPVYEDTIFRLCNYGSGDWRAFIEGQEIATGDLEWCIKHCKAMARADARKERIKQLRKQIDLLQRSEGGNWRRLKRLGSLNEKCERLIRAKR